MTTTENGQPAGVPAPDAGAGELPQPSEPPPAGNPAGYGGEMPALRFADVESWVRGMFLPMFGWRIDGQRWFWCPQWWRHAEAIWRLELLWRSWEAARLQPLGMSAFAAAFAAENESGLFNAYYERPAMLRLAGNVSAAESSTRGAVSGPLSAS